MTKIFSFLLLCVAPYLASSQGNRTAAHLDWAREEDVFLTRLAEFIPWKEKYRYIEFRDGNVFYASHKESSSIKLNYNLYLHKIEMINEQRDTSFLPNFEIIKYILLDKDLYYHDVNKGYFELLGNPNDSIRLVGQRQLRILGREEISNTDNPKLTTSKDSFSVEYFPLNHSLPREKVTLSRTISFFVMDGNDEIHSATKSSFLKLFPKSKKQIEGYLAQMARQRTPIKFDEEEGLKKLLAFCLNRP